MTAGMLVGIVVLLGATAFGLARRRTDGRLRPSRAAGQLRQARTAGQSRQARTAGQSRQARTAGRSRQPRTAGRPRQPRTAGRPGPERRLTEADLGSPLGERATLLQFSSSFCAPCRATRQILMDVARSADGVAHVELNVADRVDLVRALDVRRTPTTFLLGPDGRITSRASGPPRKDDVLAALGVVA